MPQWNDQFVALGRPLHLMSQVSTSTGAVAYFGRVDLGAVYQSFGMRVRLTGAGTSGSWQLCGTIGTSSDANSVLRPLTTFDLAAQSSDDVIFVTGKPVSSIVIAQTTPSSSGTTVDIFVGVLP